MQTPPAPSLVPSPFPSMTPPPTVEVIHYSSASVSMAGLDCSDYGDAEEKAISRAIADIIDYVR
ncbi:MAG: hypothetical protein VX181_13440, partial [Pseudomonadota bacterium]|nr:hypothetical protein [Pseudomonadota bacterium]